VLREGDSDKAARTVQEHIVIAAERTIAQLEL
jgi:hypothetical protein